MTSHDQLDAFKTCQELTRRTDRVAEGLYEKAPELAANLWSAALFAPGRMARTLDLLPEETTRELESLRGRGVFYTPKLILSLTQGTRE